MFMYRPIAFDDPCFPDGRGVLLAWSIDHETAATPGDRALYLVSSAGRFFVCASRPQRSGLIGCLEIEHAPARRLFDRVDKHMLPFPDQLITDMVDRLVVTDDVRWVRTVGYAAQAAW